MTQNFVIRLWEAYPRKRDVHPHCSTIQIEYTQGDSEGKINFWGNESIDDC
jgi:hypothetical protein